MSGLAERTRRPRRVALKVTQADLDRAAAFLKAMGARVAAIDLAPGKARIVTTDGQDLTLGGDQTELDKELETYRQNRAQRAS